jgi:hypothetical protein
MKPEAAGAAKGSRRVSGWRVCASGVLLLGVSCAAPGNRTVSDGDLLRGLVELVPGVGARVGPERSEGRATAALALSAAIGAQSGSAVQKVDIGTWTESATEDSADPGARPLDDPLAVDPLWAGAEGGVDVGLPLRVHLGAGEAPYDDGIRPLHGGCAAPPGFSDSVLSLQWVQDLGGGLAVEGRASFVREQDVPLAESLPDARLSFVVLGVRLSF